MVITYDVELPECSELNVEEARVSMATLFSAAPYIGKYCESVNNEFMLCRIERNDPRACINLGKEVTSCTLELFRQIKANCLEQFNQYALCIEKSSGDFQYRHCRNTQSALDSCMEDKMQLKRPHFGYFCRGRVHESPSPPPPPERCPCHPKYADASPGMPASYPRKDARFHSRLYWITE